MRLVEIPVPIPNTMVKHLSADDTWLETTWESKWLPDYMKIVSETEQRRSYLPILLSQASSDDCLTVASKTRQNIFRCSLNIENCIEPV